MTSGMARLTLVLATALAIAGGAKAQLGLTVDVSVLEEHKVAYSAPVLQTKFQSASSFNARGMQHVYKISHTFLDLIHRKDVLPPSINHTVLINTPKDKIPELLERHWPEILLQYIGVATVAICGVLMAVLVPIAGFCVCCCRCAGKCGASTISYDKKGDACRRVCLGVILSVFVVAAMFGVVSAFVTNQYTHEGVQHLTGRLRLATNDTSLYLDNTGREIYSLLVTNYAELEEVLNDILDESGPILKTTLAKVTQAVAIDNLASIVSGLGNVKRYLRDIQTRTNQLQDKVGQLKLGLDGTKQRLVQALRQCGEVPACGNFLKEYNIERDLALAKQFDSLQLPDVALLMRDITDLVNNDIEKKVKGGQKQLDKVKSDIDNSIINIRPIIKEEIRKMGKKLADHADEIQTLINEFDGYINTVQRDTPKINPFLEEYGDYLYYIGLGMSCLVLLILTCHVLGLFYGFCGKRPGNVYGDDCCNTGTGANWLLAGVYLTFIFSFVILSLTTAQFLIGSSMHKVVCEGLKNPNGSEVFEMVDQNIIRPLLKKQFPNQPWSDKLSIKELITRCHRNDTMYNITHMKHVYDVNELRNWRKEFGIKRVIQDLKSKIKLDDLQAIQILPPNATKDLEDLAESQISDLNFTHYTRLLEEQITSIDLSSFTRKLRQVRERLDRTDGRFVGPALDNEALFLDQMGQVVEEMKLTLRELHGSVTSLEKEAKFNKVPLREALRTLLKQASKASEFLRSEGPKLIDTLTDKYVNETVDLIDGYVERVINLTENYVGRCEPLSRSYNATTIAVCNEIIDSFNGFWSSIGWCYMFFLPSIALAIALVSLYRKSEAYPGPLVEPQTSERLIVGGAGQKKKRGHRRNASEYLPDSAHYRAGYSYQDRENRFQDMAPRSYNNQTAREQVQRSSTVVEAPQSGGPPRYTSNPSLAEYERPPPYYFPSAPVAHDMPPPLPAPNARP